MEPGWGNYFESRSCVSEFEFRDRNTYLCRLALERREEDTWRCERGRAQWEWEGAR